MRRESGTVLKLASGFAFDFTNLYGETKVNACDVAAIKERIYNAHQAIEVMREHGRIFGHLTKDGKPEKVLFARLPYIDQAGINTPASIEALKDFGRSLQYHTDAVISFGIGGSYLGNKVLFDVHCGEFWNYRTVAQRSGYPKFFFSGYNMDPRRTQELIGCILAEARLKVKQDPGEPYRVKLIVTSKSGATLDTLSTFMTVYNLLDQYKSLVEVSVVAVTGPPSGAEYETPLYRLARDQGWTTFAVPDGVGGRFSVFSEVGLITAACIGMGIDEFLAGARTMDQACKSPDLWQNPALLNAVLKYLAAEKYGRHIEVFMPYADYLKSIAEWYVQLLAESLGKRCNRTGQEVYYGRTPVVAIGTTDMHAQTQQHQDGKYDKVVQFVKVAAWEQDMIIPDMFPKEEKLTGFTSMYMGSALDAAREANAEALICDNRFNATLVMPRINAFHVGELLYMLALSVAYEGELANVNAFNQPGIDAYKRLMDSKLKNFKLQLS